MAPGQVWLTATGVWTLPDLLPSLSLTSPNILENKDNTPTTWVWEKNKSKWDVDCKHPSRAAQRCLRCIPVILPAAYGQAFLHFSMTWPKRTPFDSGPFFQQLSSAPMDCTPLSAILLSLWRPTSSPGNVTHFFYVSPKEGCPFSSPLTCHVTWGDGFLFLGLVSLSAKWRHCIWWALGYPLVLGSLSLYISKRKQNETKSKTLIPPH